MSESLQGWNKNAVTTMGKDNRLKISIDRNAKRIKLEERWIKESWEMGLEDKGSTIREHSGPLVSHKLCGKSLYAEFKSYAPKVKLL